MSHPNHTTHENDGEPDVGRVRIFDTTLRDGEQAPGFSMDRRAKMRMAHALEELGVDVMEAGFPAASPDDFAAVAEVAKAMKAPTVCALARCQPGDIDAAGKALAQARRSRIHVFLSTSPLHREHKLGKTKAEVVDIAIAAILRAKDQCHEVEFSAEDALRTEHDFLVEVFNAVADAGAIVLNAPDTVGYTTPAEMMELFTFLQANVRRPRDVIFSAHCHDDLGLAVANSMAAISAGARQVECTINGIGERAGNAAMEEIVMALRTRAPYFKVDTGIVTERLYPTSRLLANLTQQPVPRNKAIVGDNAFAHESGIHQHGMLKHRGTYEIMRPEDVGASTSLVLGKHSGRHALRQRLATLGFELDDAAMDEVFANFKKLADRKREVVDADLVALAGGVDPETQGPWHIENMHANSHVGGSASVTVQLRHDDGREASEAAIGDGPVDAMLRAVQRATGQPLELVDFQVRAISQGGDAQGHASLSATHLGHEYRGNGVSTDIVEATAHAVLAIVNRIERQSPQKAAVAAQR
ncbi:2-isopropylmalate synthase [Pinirhizobacter sp.]|jgi:2-isopropylmalate synthase|uniref:2-isopropylmalate synthase n=1 Tax=Pinirhizobacter sp. TaxID=2950432 RepID=UPI002F417652